MTERILELERQYGKQLSDLICKKVNHEDCCHDILQEVYLKMMQHMDKIEKADNVAPLL